MPFNRHPRRATPDSYEGSDTESDSDVPSRKGSRSTKVRRPTEESDADSDSGMPSRRDSRRARNDRHEEEMGVDIDEYSAPSSRRGSHDSNTEDQDGSEAEEEDDIAKALRLSKLDARKSRQRRSSVDDDEQVRRVLELSRRSNRARPHNNSDDDDDLRKVLAESEQVSHNPRPAPDDDEELQRIMEESAKEHQAFEQQQEEKEERIKEQARLEKEILKESKRLAKENESAQKEKERARRKAYKRELELVARDNKQEFDVKQRQRKAWEKRQKVLAKEREEEARAQRRAERQRTNAVFQRSYDDEDPELLAQIRAAEAMSLGDVPTEGNSDEGLPPEDCPPAFGEFANDSGKRPKPIRYTTSTRTDHKSGHLVKITPEIRAEMNRYFIRMAVEAAEELLDKKDRPPEYDDIFRSKGKTRAKPAASRWDMATAIAGGGLEDVRQAAATYQRRADHAYGPQRTQAQRLGTEPTRSSHPAPWQTPFSRVPRREDSQQRPRHRR